MAAPASSAEHRLTIGLTGGIGSGKSAVAAMLAELGAGVLDADAIAHEITAPDGTAIASIQDAFGSGMLTPAGALDRDRMRAAVFADPAKRRALESILHPRIGQAMRERAAQTSGAYLVLVIPLLVENLPRWRSAVDRIAVVDCPEDQQIARVMRRSGLNAEQIRAIMATQAAREVRRRAADDLIDNSADLAALQKRTRDLHTGYLRLAG